MRRKRRTERALNRAAQPVGAPLLVAGGVTTLLALALLLGPALRRWGSARFNPRIAFQEGRAAQPKPAAQSQAVANPAVVFEGEVSRTEVRLREAGAVAVGATLTGLALAAEKHPAQSAGALLAGMAQRGLLPPNVALAGDGQQLAGVSGTLHLRFRPAPFALEVLSLGRERRDGPALLLRVPDTGAGQAPTRYYHALTLTQVKVPAPFATPTALLASGWAVATLKPQTPDGADPAQLATWAQEQTAAP